MIGGERFGVEPLPTFDLVIPRRFLGSTFVARGMSGYSAVTFASPILPNQLMVLKKKLFYIQGKNCFEQVFVFIRHKLVNSEKCIECLLTIMF